MKLLILATGNDEPYRAVQNVDAEAHPRNRRLPGVHARRRVLRPDVPLDGGESGESLQLDLVKIIIIINYYRIYMVIQ